MKPVYLDYAATTPVDPRVLEAMKPFFGAEFGNPGSLHSFGQRASGVVFEARQTIARALGAHYSEIVFTGSATEANNLALRGAMMTSGIKKPRIIISAIEHESVLETAQDCMQYGFEIVVIPVSKDGIVDLKKLKTALNDRTVLVSVMYVNNETGTIQPIAEIGKIIQAKRGSGKYPLFHTDAVQAFQYLPCRVDELGADLMTLSAHKIYGPKGIGVLYVRNVGGVGAVGYNSNKRSGPTTQTIQPLITGGGQEEGLRSGTENVPYIAGFGKAVEIAEKMRAGEVKRICDLRNYAWRQIKKSFKNAQMNGGRTNRIPNNLNFYLPGVLGEKVLVGLDLAGIAVSSGPACSARTLEPSHVLLACGFNKERAKNSIRISLGRPTTKAEIAYLLATLKKLAH